MAIFEVASERKIVKKRLAAHMYMENIGSTPPPPGGLTAMFPGLFCAYSLLVITTISSSRYMQVEIRHGHQHCRQLHNVHHVGIFALGYWSIHKSINFKLIYRFMLICWDDCTLVDFVVLISGHAWLNCSCYNMHDQVQVQVQVQ